MKQVLWNKEIEQIKESGYLSNEVTITDALIENFYQEIMGDEEKMLVNLLLSDVPSQDMLNKLLSLWDIDTKQAPKSLLLAYLLKTHSNLNVTGGELPRLNGLLLNQKFKNLNIISYFTKIGKELNKNGIIPIIIKGGLMKFLNPDFPRYMGDIDILVKENQWLKSAKIAKSLGYNFKRLDNYSFDILENKNSKYGILDIHKSISFGNKNEKKWLKNICKRATQQKIYGVDVLVPAYEDLLFITLINLSNNLRYDKSRSTLLYSIFDCKYLLENKSDFDWNIVIENAKLSGCEVQVNFAIKFINKISGDILPDNLQNSMLFEKETNDYSRMILFKHFYYIDLQKKCRAMKIQEVFKSPLKIGEYLNSKVKYKLLKCLSSHPRLIEILIKDLNRIYNN